MKCHDFCCNPDGDEFGNWCFVKDKDCEEAEWGYCMPVGGDYQHGQFGECTDVAGWRDSEGDGCWIYADEAWCTDDGKPGSGWDKEWGALDDYWSQGHSSLTACCACGGGTTAGDA